MRAVLVPSAACGMPGSAGSPSPFSSSTAPASGWWSEASTDRTSSSGSTGGSAGCAPAPAGIASRPSPTAPATAIPAAAVRPILLLRAVAMGHSVTDVR
jgi:hypothetical protein